MALTAPLTLTATSHAGTPLPSSLVNAAPGQPEANLRHASSPTAAQVSAARRRVTDLNRSLRALAPYVRVNSDNTETLFWDKAKRAGFPSSLLALAVDLIRYQNAMLRRARQIKYHGTLPSVALADYPRVRDLFTVATVAAVKQLRSRRSAAVHTSALDLTAHPCGDWSRPRPTSNPARSRQGPFGDAKASLQRSGYHPTAGYACGRSSLRICRGDYTRAHRMSTSAGVCASPRFRDQASLSGSMPGYIYVQYGEPNPEIAAYSWPYWSWAAYVVWWHRNY